MYRKFINLKSSYIENLRLFSLNARLFLIGTFFLSIGVTGFMLLFNLYLKSIGFQESKIGHIITITTIGTVIMAIPASIVIKKFSIKKIIITSIPIALFSYFLQVATSNYLIILSGGLLAGFASVFGQVIAAPFFMRNSTTKERPYLFSANFACSLVAGILGSILGGFLPGIIEKYGLVEYLTYRYTLYVFGGLVLIALIPFFMIHESGVPEVPEPTKLITDRSIIIKLFLPTLVVGIGAGLSIPFINLYFQDVLSIPVKLIGIYFSLSQVLMIAGLLIAPVLSEKIGKIRTVVFSQFFSIPFLIILGVTHNAALAVGAFLIRAAMMNMAQPLFTNFAMESVRKEEQPLTNALLVIAWTAGRGLSASIGGVLIEKYSYSIPFFITSALYLISTILILGFFNKEKMR